MAVLIWEMAKVEAVVASRPNTGTVSDQAQSGILLLVFGRYITE